MSTSAQAQSELLQRVLHLREDFSLTLAYRLRGIAKHVLSFAQQPSAGRRQKALVRIESLHQVSNAFRFKELAETTAAFRHSLLPVLDANRTKPVAPDEMLVIKRGLESLRKAAKRGINTLSPSSDDAPATLLMIENDPEQVAQLSLQFSLMGYTTDIRHDLSEVMTERANVCPRAVIINADIVGDDLSMLDSLRDAQSEYPKKTPIILLSPEDDTAARLRAIRAGVDGYFTKPVDVDALGERLRELSPQQSVSAYTVMVVDDSPKRSRKVASALKRSGIETLLVNDPPRVREAFERETPDLVLLDVHMSTVDARALAAKLRKTRGLEDLPVVLFSAKSAMGSQGSSSGAVPDEAIRSEQLLALVTNHLYRTRELKNQSTSQRNYGELAKLSNMDYFLSAVENAVTIAQKGTQTFGVLYVGLDNVESLVSDGSKEQSQLFVQTSEERLLVQIRSHDIAARYSENAFLVLVKNVDADGARIVGSRIRKGFSEELFECGDLSFPVTCTIGVSVIDAKPTSTEKAISDVESAFSVAVASGGDNVHLHDDVADALAREKREAAQIRLVKGALSSGSFKLMFQPVVSLRNDRVEAFETTLSLHDDEQREISPQQLAALIARAALSLDIDKWLVSRVVEFIADKFKRNRTLRLMVTLSKETLKDSGFAAWVARLIEQAGIPSSCLVVGFSTDVVSTHLKDAQAMFKCFADARIATRLTHFGRTTNPMLILEHVSVSYLSMDGAIVQGTAKDYQAEKALGMMVESAHAKKCAIIAPSVEDPSMLSTLWDCRVDLIQGTFVGKPTPTIDNDWSGNIDLSG